MRPVKIPKYVQKRLDILAYLQEFAWVNPRAVMKELHQQGIDVSVVLINKVLADNGWLWSKMDNCTIVWFNPDVQLPQPESVATTGVLE